VSILSRDATQSFRVPRRDSNRGSSEPESDALTTRRSVYIGGPLEFVCVSFTVHTLFECFDLTGNLTFGFQNLVFLEV
jgi:hypothetical protein